MPVKKTPQRIALEEARLSFLKWGYEKNRSTPFDKYEEWVADYPDWNSLRGALVDFLKKKQSNRWTEAEIELVNEVVNLDVHKCLFRSFCEEEFCKLIYQKSPADSLRSTLLHNVPKVIKNEELRKSLYLYFLETDTPYVRDHAFRFLAHMGWDGTEKYASMLWAKGDLTDKVGVIMGLRFIRTPLLDYYLEELLVSGDDCTAMFAASVKERLKQDQFDSCKNKENDV